VEDIVSLISLMDRNGTSVAFFRTKDHAVLAANSAKHIILGPLTGSNANQIKAWKALYMRRMFYRLFFIRRTKSTVRKYIEHLPRKNEVVIWLEL
jgi:hypothetical protein